MTPRLALLAVVAALAACGRGAAGSASALGVRVSVDATGLAELREGARVAALASEPAGLQIRSLYDGELRQGPFVIELALRKDGARSALRLHGLHAKRRDDGAAVASAEFTRDEGDLGELTATLDPAVSGLAIRARGVRVEPGASLILRVRVPRRDVEVRLGDLPPEPVESSILSSSAPWIVVGAARPLLLGALAPFAVVASPETLVAELSREASPDGAVELDLALSIAADVRAAAALGARLSKGARRKGAELAIEVRDHQTGAALPARVLIEGTPRAPLVEPLVLDPTREAEPGAPLVDAYRPRTSIVLPPGRWTLIATHGIGWSIAQATLDLEDGDALRVPIELVEEAPMPGWVGCDLHVHARGSFDARAVSYEDRVRSLVAVGVDCAAATEHDHVDSHEPAAKALGLEPIFRGAPGVELTTDFGHFNAYPWPDGAPVPRTRPTSPRELFGAVHALAGAQEIVLQVNHPRMRTGIGQTIGYFELSRYDALAGAGRGGIVPYLRDYDALEVFNGYQLPNPSAVEAMIDEWVTMLDHGDVHVATGSSDSHWIQFPWAGFPRTYVRVGPAWRPEGRPFAAVARAIKLGRAIVTSGPLLDVDVGGAQIGDLVRGGGVARVTVRLTSWLAAPTLRVLLGHEALAVALVRAPAAANTWIADVAVPKVDRKLALVAIATAKVLDEGRVVKGMETAIGFTNPVWIVP